MPISPSLLSCVLMLGSGAACFAEKAPGPIAPSSVEVKLVPDKTKVMLGEPVFLSYIVTNKTAVDLQVIVGGDYQNEWGRPETFTVTALAEDGKPVAQPASNVKWGGGISAPQRIPASGTYSFRLFLPHWATIDHLGRYTIVAKRTLKLSDASAGASAWMQKTTDLPSEARTEIEIVPPDPVELGKIIDTLGAQWVAQKHRTESQEPGIALKSIHDERVIPELINALRTDDYSLKFVALEALSSFNNDQALDGLREGMKTTGLDIGSTTNAKLGDQLAENIRHAAAVGLSKSPHPAALKLLLDQNKDASYAVRHTVVQALGTRVSKDQAIPLLQEMLTDSNQMVRDEARHYFDQLSAHP